MKSMIATVVLGVVLSAVQAAGAVDGKVPPVGSYGFDSLAPAKTQCAKLDAGRIGKLTKCTWSKSNSFGDDRAGWSCRVGRRDGFMVYATRNDCQAELDLERANGD